MLLSDMKREHSFRGRTETKISFEGEISHQRKHETVPRDQIIKGQNLHLEMCNPLPLMSKGEEEQATGERILKGKQ